MTFDTIDAMWYDALESLRSAPNQTSRDGDTRELIGYSAELVDPSMCWLHNEGRLLDPRYACAEIAWYLSGSSNVAWMRRFAPQYSRFAEPDGKANGAYGGRLFKGGIDQIRYVISTLKRRPDSRQAIITMWDISDLPSAYLGDKRDLPCTLTLQFLLRGRELHLIVNMRSNDIWLGMPYDIFWFCTLQRLVAWELSVNLGRYFHRVGSLHLYDRDAGKASKVLAFRGVSTPSWETYNADSLEGLRKRCDQLLNDNDITHGGGLIAKTLSIACCKVDNWFGADAPIKAAKERRDDRARGA